MAEKQRQTKEGRCEEHGEVQAWRTMPPLKFPFFYYGLLRAFARLRPYRCPHCGARATV